jgi:hypothetical protein
LAGAAPTINFGYYGNVGYYANVGYCGLLLVKTPNNTVYVEGDNLKCV